MATVYVCMNEQIIKQMNVMDGQPENANIVGWRRHKNKKKQQQSSDN